jgi:hypothetical protein
MAEISDWRLTELKEHEKSYYELKKRKGRFMFRINSHISTTT